MKAPRGTVTARMARKKRRIWIQRWRSRRLSFLRNARPQQRVREKREQGERQQQPTTCSGVTLDRSQAGRRAGQKEKASVSATIDRSSSSTIPVRR